MAHFDWWDLPPEREFVLDYYCNGRLAGVKGLFVVSRCKVWFNLHSERLLCPLFIKRCRVGERVGPAAATFQLGSSIHRCAGVRRSCCCCWRMMLMIFRCTSCSISRWSKSGITCPSVSAYRRKNFGRCHSSWGPPNNHYSLAPCVFSWHGPKHERTCTRDKLFGPGSSTSPILFGTLSFNLSYRHWRCALFRSICGSLTQRIANGLVQTKKEGLSLNGFFIYLDRLFLWLFE